MKTGIIVQARLGSTRLPNKMILPFRKDKGILEVLLIRLLEAIDTEQFPIILATTQNPLDDDLEEIGNRLGVAVVRGSENDVLNRFLVAAKAYNIGNIIRVCADNPLLDMALLKQLIIRSQKGNYDYYSFATSTLKPTILSSYGFWGESVKLEALERVAEQTKEALYREHVTNYVYTHQDQFNVHFDLIDPEIEKLNNIRLTVDTKADFELVKEIYRILKENDSDFSSNSILKLIASRPEWTEIMETEIAANKK